MENDIYFKQAENFLKKTGTEFKTKFIKHDKYFDEDKEKRDIYEITLKRGEREYKFSFGQSIACSGGYKYYDNVSNDFKQLKKLVKILSLTKSQCRINDKQKEPSPYDVLACLTKNDPGDFKNFCSDYGYNEDSIQANKIYESVVDEWKNIQILYSDEEISELQEII